MMGDEILGADANWPRWLDTPCSVQDRHCTCDEFVYGEIVWSCESASGTYIVDMSTTDEIKVTDIPVGVRDLRITLTSEVDIDLKLYIVLEEGETEVCIVGYGCGTQNMKDQIVISQNVTSKKI